MPGSRPDYFYSELLLCMTEEIYIKFETLTGLVATIVIMKPCVIRNPLSHQIPAVSKERRTSWMGKIIYKVIPG